MWGYTIQYQLLVVLVGWVLTDFLPVGLPQVSNWPIQVENGTESGTSSNEVNTHIDGFHQNLLTTLPGLTCPRGWYLDEEFDECVDCEACRPCNGSVVQPDCLGWKYECGQPTCYADGCSSNPCVHGTCSKASADDFYNYTCDCKTGWTGVNCSEKFNYCLFESCNNGGTCVNQLTDFSCVCTSFYNGRHCKDFDYLLLVYIGVSLIIGVIFFISLVKMYIRRNKIYAYWWPLSIPEGVPEIFTGKMLGKFSFKGVPPSKVKELASELKLSNCQVSVQCVQERFQNDDVYGQMIEILKDYQQEFREAACVRVVLNSLYKIGLREIAKNLIKEFLADEQTPLLPNTGSSIAQT